MEARSLEVQHLSGTALALLSGAQTSEILRGTRHTVRTQFHLDPSLGRTADGNVEENDGILAHFAGEWVLARVCGTDGGALVRPPSHQFCW